QTTCETRAGPVSSHHGGDEGSLRFLSEPRSRGTRDRRDMEGAEGASPSADGGTSRAAQIYCNRATGFEEAHSGAMHIQTGTARAARPARLPALSYIARPLKPRRR